MGTNKREEPLHYMSPNTSTQTSGKLKGPIGTITSIFNSIFVIQASPAFKPLSQGCIVVLKNMSVVGYVEEIFGSVLLPMYIARFVCQKKKIEIHTRMLGNELFVMSHSLRFQGNILSEKENKNIVDETEFSEKDI